MSKRKNLKNAEQSLKLRNPSDAVKRKPISFSYEYLTANDMFTFVCFGKNLRGELEARRELDKLLFILSSSTWEKTFAKAKDAPGGAETIEAHQVHFMPSNYPVSGDTKYVVFRFFRQKYRAIGIREGDVFHICGFDFAHNAYDH